MIARVFGISTLVTAASLVVAYVYQGWTGLGLCLIVGILEVSLSFDNAIVNATVLKRMSAFWQRIFLTVGVLIAVFGMRLLFPLVVVWITGHLNPVDAIRLAMNPPSGGATHFPDGSPSYQTVLLDAHPQIAAFGGMFLLLLFLEFVLHNRGQTWLSWIERPLARLGRLDQLAVVIALSGLVLVAEYLAVDSDRATVLIAGLLGAITFIVVDGLSSLFRPAPSEATDGEADATGASGSGIPVAVCKAAFVLFVYLEVLDASFSFDGVVGAFAITPDPIIIVLGLGFIGAMFVRSITIYLVRKGTLDEYRYLEHGAHWAIGALAVILLVSVRIHINEVLTGLVGVAFIAAALVTSIRANRRDTHPTAVRSRP